MKNVWDECWGTTENSVLGDYPNGVIRAIGEFDTTDQARLAAAAPDLVRVLLAVEWEGDEGKTTCPWCGWRLEHNKMCALDLALRKAGVR